MIVVFKVVYLNFIIFYSDILDIVREMKKKFLESSINSIVKKYPDYDNDKIDEIAYGLEAIYLTFTKTIVIFSMAFVLGVFKEMLLVLLFYNIIRTTAFGMHAKKSFQCLILSTIMFVGGGLICKYINFNVYVKITATLLSFICLIKYAPADTYKRPLINAKKRKIYKFLTVVTGFIYVILIIIFNGEIISNYLMLGLLEATLMIHPLMYRMFQLPYNNYKNFVASYS